MARVAKKVRKRVARKRGAPPRKPTRRRVPSIQDEVYAIHVAQTEYREAFNSGEVERLLRVFHPEFTDMSESVPTFFGEDAPLVLRRRMTRLFGVFDTRMGQAAITVQVMGGTAYSYGWRQVTLRPKRGGPAKTARFRFLELWRKNETGVWKLEMVIDNAEPPLTLPEVELPIPWFRIEEGQEEEPPPK